MTTRYVDQFGDDGGSGTIGSPYATIGKAWSVASADDIIDLSGYFNWYQDPTFTAGGIAIDKNITFRGQSGSLARIDCCASVAGQSRVFNLTTASTTVSFENLEIFNGKNNDVGCPIGRSSVNMSQSFTNVWFHDNVCGTTGSINGDMFLTVGGGTSICNNCTWSDNTVKGKGDLFDVKGSGTKTFINCTVYRNEHDYPTSYAALLMSGGTTFVINCTFFDNNMAGCSLSGSAEYYIKNCIFASRNRVYSIGTKGGSVVQVWTRNNLIGEDYPFNPTNSYWINPNNTGGYASITNVPDASFGTFGLNGSLTGIPVVPILASNFAVGNGSIDDEYKANQPARTDNIGPAMPTHDARGVARVLESGYYDIGAYAYTVAETPAPSGKVYLKFIGASV